MTSRQKRLSRSGALEPKSTGCKEVWASDAPATMTAIAVSPWKDDADDDFVLSVRVSFGSGAGTGAGLLFEHWQELPGDCVPPWQQQELGPPAEQQERWDPQRAASLAQQELRPGDLAVQCGHAAPKVTSTPLHSTLAGRWDWFPQAQAIRGMVSTGTSTPASQTRTLAVKLWQKCTG